MDDCMVSYLKTNYPECDNDWSYICYIGELESFDADCKDVFKYFFKLILFFFLKFAELHEKYDDDYLKCINKNIKAFDAEKPECDVYSEECE